ncbi:MAG: peroxiredoxin [Gammaproteobacteria bacterium]|nr:peroxiredoxin [Gammaproteobacteria bacterium]
MIHLIRKILIKSITLVSIILPWQINPALAEESELKVGDPAPAFSLYDQHNKQQSLIDYKGQWLVIYFYPRDDTPGCTREACNFRDDILKIRNLNSQVIGISTNDIKSHKDFSEKYSLPFPLLADPDGEVAKKYGSFFSLWPIKFAKRHSFIINPEGKIAKIYRDVDTETHSQEIITDLTKLVNNTN